MIDGLNFQGSSQGKEVGGDEWTARAGHAT